MYVSARRSWFSLLFVSGRSVLPHIWGRAIGTTLIALALTIAHQRTGFFHGFSLTPVPFTMIGVPLGIFLGFRNNTSYDRFWEGRRMWGGLVNTSRSLGRQILTLVEQAALYTPEGDVDGASRPAPEITLFQRAMVHRVAAFAHALRLHLRGQPIDELARLLPEAEVEALRAERNVPTAIVFTMGRELQTAWHRGWIHPQHLPVLDASLTELTNIQGACERIKNTPIPFSYTVLIHRIVAFYCFLLPLGLVDSIRWLSPVVVLFVSYVLFGLDAIGDEVEDPFGTDVNDLPLTALSTTIEINLRQRLGETDLPAAPQPVDGVLS